MKGSSSFPSSPLLPLPNADRRVEEEEEKQKRKNKGGKIGEEESRIRGEGERKGEIERKKEGKINVEDCKSK